jgi:hypothetical protein
VLEQVEDESGALSRTDAIFSAIYLWLDEKVLQKMAFFLATASEIVFCTKLFEPPHALISRHLLLQFLYQRHHAFAWFSAGNVKDVPFLFLAFCKSRRLFLWACFDDLPCPFYG